MNTIIRCHVKNNERLITLEKEIISYKEKGLDILGDLYIVDDGSPLQSSVISMCGNHKANYIKASNTPDTKNGLAESLRLMIGLGGKYPSLLCVDDAVFGRGILGRLTKLLHEELPIINPFGMVGLFACYEDNTRNHNKILGTDIWKIDHKILYALVAHVFSFQLAAILVDIWDKVQEGSEPYPGMCDDIWVATVCAKYNIPCYNTMMDYAQHTGMNNRTFGDNTGSEYQSKMFVGE